MLKQNKKGYGQHIGFFEKDFIQKDELERNDSWNKALNLL